MRYPCLQSSMEKLFQNTQRELSTIEGNLYTAGADAKKLYVTSCYPGEGKTVSAIGLALGLSENDRQVLLIDSNSHNPCLHILFQTSISPGLSEVSDQVPETDRLFQKTKYPNLFIMPFGRLPTNQHSARKQIQQLDKYKLFERFDFVIVDGHAVLSSSHVSLVAKQFDGVLLTVQCERTKRQVIRQVNDKIDQSGGRILGVILNRRKTYIPKFLYNRI